MPKYYFTFLKPALRAYILFCLSFYTPNLIPRCVETKAQDYSLHKPNTKPKRIHRSKANAIEGKRKGNACIKSNVAFFMFSILNRIQNKIIL